MSDFDTVVSENEHLKYNRHIKNNVSVVLAVEPLFVQDFILQRGNRRISYPSDQFACPSPIRSIDKSLRVPDSHRSANT